MPSPTEPAADDRDAAGRGRRGSKRGLCLFFATDLHGSDVCFRKLLAAPKVYGADALLLGGDIVGSTLVPITRTSDGYAAEFDGHAVSGLSSAGLNELTTSIRRRGAYAVVGTVGELEDLNDAQEFDLTLRREIKRSLEDWVALAEERLHGTGVRLFVVPGGQDPSELDSVWDGAESVVLAGDSVVPLDDNRELLAVRCSTPTRSHRPREVSELQMRSRLEGLAERVGQMADALVAVHTPPYNCALDHAPLLDANGAARGGQTVPVGSIAVRDFIETHQPLLGTHGQVHETNASCRLAGTLCVNPGTQASEGWLSGALIQIRDRSASAHMISGQ